LGYVYKICHPGGGIDVNKRLGTTHSHADEHEVAFPESIHPKYILKATQYDRFGSAGTPIYNPAYNPGR
jgi:hypothetical protein